MLRRNQREVDFLFSLYHKLHHLPICSSDINPSLSDICLETFFFSSLKLSAWKNNKNHAAILDLLWEDV